MITPVAALAQTADSPAAPLDQVKDETKKVLKKEERRQSVIVYPSAISGTTLSDAGIVAGDKDKRAFINYAFRPTSVMDLVLSASTPLADEGATGLIQLDGLASKTKVGVATHFGVHRLPSEEQIQKIFDKLWPLCLELMAAKAEKLAEQVKKNSKNAQQDKEGAQKPKANGGEDNSGIKEEGCNFEELDQATVRTALAPYRRTTWFFTGEASTGPETFKFADPLALAGDDVKQTQWSKAVSGKAGFLLSNNVYASFGVRIEKAYEAQKNKAVCPAVPAPQPVACAIKPVGEPDPKRRNVVEAEVRRFIGPHAGISSIARWDWNEGDKSIEVPLYLVRDKDGGLRGGIAYGHVWSSKPDSSGDSLTIFVSQTFSLAP
jgi:hypothetical protein